MNFIDRTIVASIGQAIKVDLKITDTQLGLLGGLSSRLGTLIGGPLADRLGRDNAAWYALTPALGLALATPIYEMAYLQTSLMATLAILLLPGIFHFTYLAPTYGVVQNVVEIRRRATATAVLMFFLNLVALGGGPPFTGWLIDRFAAVNFLRAEPGNVWSSLSGSLARTGPGLQASCPGGLAPDGAPRAIAARCKASLAIATRHGMLVTVSIYFWASLHYALGTIGLGKALAAAHAKRSRGL